MRRIVASRRFRWTATLIVISFLLVNAGLFAFYNNRTYPNTQVGSQELGSVSRANLQPQLKKRPLLPHEVTFEHDGKSTKVAINKLGINLDYNRLEDQAMRNRSWLPVINLFQSHQTPLYFTHNQTALRDTTASALAQFERAPANARISPQGDIFVIKPEVAGLSVDTNTTINRLLSNLSHGQATIKIATKSINPAIESTSLKKQLDELNAQTKTTITLNYNSQARRLSTSEILTLYAEEASVMSLSDAAILTLVNAIGSGYGIVVDNQAAAVATIKTALQQHKELSYTLVAAPKAVKTIRYCTAVRGVSESELSNLNATLQSVFADSRGWSLSGLVRFERVGASCDFYVWLTAASQMPTFGAICDPEWSCAVSPHVVINYTRWQETSPAWAASGGSREDYRAMVINHETGHWFGFHHSSCPAAGQPAPVMQQQSINLQGCNFNPWPTAAEQAALKQRLGL